MSRTDIPQELADEIRKRIFDEKGWMKLTQVLHRGGEAFKISLRPVTLKGEKRYQGEMTDKGRTSVKNFDADAARKGVEDILAQTGPRELHLITGSGDLHVRITRKGRALVSRSAPMAREVEEAPAHDRAKSQPLTAFDSSALLKAIDIADADGRIKASMRGKYDQVNAFLKALEAVVAEKADKALNIVDCGCGRAYLTLAAYHYLTHAHGFDVRVCGIDRNPGIIETAQCLAARLDVAQHVAFLPSDIAAADPGFAPDLVMSLHACDTATDEALARGIEWKSRYLLCAPCCQHELHKSLKGGGPMQALLRHGIVRERFADLLTDTFRAQILRILGFRVNVVEFVSAEATSRNILLKAEFAVKPGHTEAVSEYLALRDLWNITPWLETRLASLLQPHIG
ncbi:MAG: SAM-dependent methyltransferase [Kiritimatiellaeota bacterium]|nr:SAM-dependent methyltransferase [Kiritimatiellota bacterium]